MKDYRQANRGRSFEDFVRFANQRYEHYNLAYIEKIPTEFLPIRNAYGKICSAKVTKKSSVDFIGRYKHYPIAVETKDTRSSTIRFDRVERHQFDFFKGFGNSEGVITLVLISFDLTQFYAIPWVFWQAAYEERVIKGNRTTKLTVDAYGVVWDIPKKNSIRADDIPKEFEVPGNNTRYGLHYLLNADNYVKRG